MSISACFLQSHHRYHEPSGSLYNNDETSENPPRIGRGIGGPETQRDAVHV
jgi:hypothetical protein